MKIEFKSLSIEGFCSISNLPLDLNRDYVTIIRGKNGNGKSTILSALVWVLYGKNIKGISDVNTWEKYRPKDYQGTKVEIEYSIEKNNHKIIRCQNYKGKVHGVKGNSGVFYFINNVLINDKYKANIQSKIEENLGMSYNLFLNSVMFGQGMKRILTSSSSDQKKVLEEVFELQYISKAYRLAKDKLDNLNVQIREFNTTKNSLENTQESLGEIIEDYKYQLEHKEGEIYEKIQGLRNKIINLKLTYKRPKSYNKDSIDYKAITRKLNDDLDKINKDIEDTNKTITETKRDLSKLNRTSDIPLSDLVDLILKYLDNNNIKRAKQKLHTLKKALSEIDSLSLELDIQGRYLQDLKNAQSVILNMLRDNESIHNNILSLREQIYSYKQFKPLNPKILKKNQDKLNEIDIQIKDIDTKTKPLYDDRELYEWLCSNPLSNNGLKAYIFDNSLYAMNKVLREYSEVLGFRIVLGMDLSSARKDLTVDIYLNNINVFYEELSGGQKQLVNLAIAFAMNSLVSSSRGLNLVFLDEIFESLSSDNIEIVINLINHIYQGKSLFLITHQESLPLSNCKILKVDIKNGLSTYSF